MYFYRVTSLLLALVKVVPISKTLCKGRLLFHHASQIKEVGMSTQTTDQDFIERCRTMYQQLLPRLIADHRGKVVAIEPESAEYFLGETLDSASEHSLARYPDRRFGFFCLDESPVVVKLR